MVVAALVSLALPVAMSSRFAKPAPAIVATTEKAVAASLPGREADARVVAIVFSLATAGIARCPVTTPAAGLLFQHLSQFQLGDRAHLAAGQALARGPEVIATVIGGPADHAAIRPGDVLLAVDGVEVPAETGLDQPFDVAQARARADAVDDLLAGERASPRTLTLLRSGATITARLIPLPACPSRPHLARSTQHNAYADGRHVLLTTGFLARLRSDDELAFVIAHEMAHNILGHAALMHGGEVRAGLGHNFGRSGAIVRQAERDADRLGAELMLDAGYDPVAGVAVVERLGGLDLGLLTSHDSARSRIAAVRRLVADRPVP